MRKIFQTLFIGFSLVLNAHSTSYVDDSIKIINNDDENKEPYAWSICSVAYQFISEIIQEDTPAKAKQFSDYSNGAELAVMISIVTNDITDDMSSEKFARIWEFSKFLGDEILETVRTTLLADLESDQSEGKSIFLGDLNDTVKVCIENLDGQQTYIDIWRELYKSGLLKSPE